MNKLKYREYKNEILSVIRKTFPKIHRKLIRDDDIVVDLISTAILADEKFNGIGDQRGYRLQRIKWHLYKLYKKYKDKQNIYSLDYIYDSDNKLSELLEDKKTFQDFKNKETINDILDTCGLTKYEKERIKHKYLYGKTIQEIGKENGISYQAVDKSILRGLDKIRRYLNVKTTHKTHGNSLNFDKIKELL